VLLAGPLTDVLPGPACVREPLAVTLAAQLGVAPVLLATFGPLPVASLPANLLAVPAAGLVMAWGLTGGMVAGLADGTPAELAHLPTRLLLGWLAEVAARASRLPLGQLEVPHLIGLAGGLATARSLARPLVRRAGLTVAGCSVVAAIVLAQAPAPLRSGLLTGVVRWHDGATDLVVLGGAGGRSPLGSATVLAALREGGVGPIDLLVVADPSISPAVVLAVERRHRLGVVVLAPGVDLLDVDATQVHAPRHSVRLEVGTLDVVLAPTADRLVVDARPVGPDGTPR
jgi:competence protein ComEC